MSRVTQVARQAEVEVRVLANLPQMLTARLAFLKVGPAIAVALRPVRLSGPQAAMKRIIDLAVASVALLLSLPLWPVIALAIRLDSRGPVAVPSGPGDQGRPDLPDAQVPHHADRATPPSTRPGRSSSWSPTPG